MKIRDSELFEVLSDKETENISGGGRIIERIKKRRRKAGKAPLDGRRLKKFFSNPIVQDIIDGPLPGPGGGAALGILINDPNGPFRKR